MPGHNVYSFSVIIPTYNRAAVVERTIRHLDKQQYPSNRFEVIVVDNSTDETPAVVERLATETLCRVRMLRTSAWHPAVKRNLALEVADGDVVLFLNDDVWAEPTLLAEHARTHASHAPAPVAVLGHVDQSSEMPPSAFTEFYRPYAYFELATRPDRPAKWWYFWTPNVSVPRRVLLDRQMFMPEDFAEIAHDDIEFGYRWTRAGYQLIYNPRARGAHYHPHDLASACRLQEKVGRELPHLNAVVDEPRLLERYGVFSWDNSRRAIVRGAIREALFNRWSVPVVQGWLARQTRNTRLTRWLYWKVLLHHTNRGYRGSPWHARLREGTGPLPARRTASV
jgi:glycosyltransferase involved in cell wall biosynthesis